MSDTIGDLIDKLSIANIRLWNVEDGRREFCQKDEKDAEKAIKYMNMVSNINKERNSLIDQINASLRVLIDQASGEKSSFNLTAEELLGTGKNKFYKHEEQNNKQL